ncbi:MAG: hypothetical protein ACJ71K_19485 [Nitrososphaeraceae archaeon]|jgi:hypothetical protein
MPQLSRKATFYAVLAAGIAFIVIGIASVLYNNIPVDVPLTGTIKPSMTDILTPNMNIGNTAHVVINGSVFNVIITDPNKQLMKSADAVSNFDYNLIAKKEGVHRIEIKNIGTSELAISGHAKTKGNEIAFGGQMMLIITGIIVTGFSLRLRH